VMEQQGAYNSLPDAIKEQMPQGIPSAPSGQTSGPVAPSPILPPAEYEANKAGLAEAAKKKAETASADDERMKVGTRVGKVATALYNDITKNEKLFSEAAGPMRAYASEAHPLNPARAIYESDWASDQDSKTRAYLSKTRQYTQSIKSELQRAYLKGTGPATEAERAEINKLIDDIPSSRNIAEAKQKIVTVLELMNTSFGSNIALPEGAKPVTGDAIDAADYFKGQ
jgi:hypothetical protein